MRAKRRGQQRLWQGDEAEGKRAAMRAAWETVARIQDGAHPEKNPMRQMRLLLTAFKDLMDYIELQRSLICALTSASLAETPNANLAWSQEEDYVLVDSRAKGEPIHLTASALGRTPAACATRISLLVGIPRDQVVERYLSGELEGDQVHGLFHGRIFPLREVQA